MLLFLLCVALLAFCSIPATAFLLFDFYRSGRSFFVPDHPRSIFETRRAGLA